MTATAAAPSDMGKWIRLGVCFLVGAIIWFLPVPEGVENPKGWCVFAVFVATILSLILRPIPMATSVLLGLLVLVLTQSMAEKPKEEPEAARTEKAENGEKPTKKKAKKWNGSKESLKVALKGFADTTTWLVVAAFLISGAVIKTGLGTRISLFLIHKLGRSPLGLAYGIGAAELVLGPAVPSNTARGGGILAPIVDALCRTLTPEGGTAPRNAPINQYLILCGAHTNLITAAMFLTGMAANSLVSDAASDYLAEPFDWGTWALGSIVPGLAGLILLPLFLGMLVRPTGVDVSAARAVASDQLKKLGPVTYGEKVLAVIFVVLLALWSTGKFHGLHTTVVALMGVLAILLTGVLSWKDMAKNHGAWDAMVWLGGLVLMASLLKEFGVVSWFAESAKVWVQGFGGIQVAILLALIYFYSMYSFSMLTGHITAMVGAFLAVAVASGAPPLLMVALLAYFSNLCGCLTNYSTGPVVIYFGMNYVTAPRWLRIGALVSLFHIAVWLGVGLVWWKIIGWW